MTTIQLETHINAPRERVWEIIADLGAVANFHPFVTRSFYTSQAKNGTGASRVCEFGNGLVIEETAVDWREGEAFMLKVAFLRGRTPPVKNVSGGFLVKGDATGVIVAMKLAYDPKFGPFGALLDRLVVRRQYRKLVAGILEGLKHHVETGEYVDLKVLKRIHQTTPIAA